jgi:hypothetical protein
MYCFLVFENLLLCTHECTYIIFKLLSCFLPTFSFLKKKKISCMFMRHDVITAHTFCADRLFKFACKCAIGTHASELFRFLTCS